MKIVTAFASTSLEKIRLIGIEPAIPQLVTTDMTKSAHHQQNERKPHLSLSVQHFKTARTFPVVISKVIVSYSNPIDHQQNLAHPKARPVSVPI